MDAASTPHQSPAYEGIPTVAVAELDPEILKRGSERKNTGAKGFSLLVAIGLNVLVLLLLAWWTIASFTEEEIELIVESGQVESLTQVDKKQFQKKQQTKPTPAAGSQAPPLITSAVADPTAVFVVETRAETEAFGIGEGWGKGAGFGSGGAGGGSVGFFGSRSTAQRVVFCVDASASLSTQQFSMIKRELNKSLKKLAAAIQYQVIFFSGPAWFAEDEHSGSKNNHVVKHGGKKYQWKTKGGASAFYMVGEKDLYTADWLSATSSNLSKTRARIEAESKSYGTDWRHPLRMALQMKPKPDVVYFLTDGAVSNGQQAVDQVIKINNRGKKAKINTIAMMLPKRGADLLGELAKKTGGEFTVVMADGTVKNGMQKK
ncbi:MAG: hypothetical protein GY899_12700 [Verrucomicrobiaceae bacterium]|nr:hypothetical protein [Verrucomicrobiaceae bacterium]